MSFSEVVIEPSEVKHPNALVLYPYPIFGNVQNTGSRLQSMADIAGIPVVASDLYLQDKKTIFDMPAKEANQPEGDVYKDMSKRRAEFYTNIADRLGATTRVGMGDSLAVSAIQGMQLHTNYETFDAVLLRDGWNLDQATTSLSGIFRYAKYQVKDIFHQRRDKVSFDIPSTEYDNFPKEKSETSTFEKLKNVADMMRGSHNLENAIALAALTNTAMNVVTFENGLSTSDANVLEGFNVGLRKVRYVQPCPSPLTAETHPGWHSDLLDPIRGAGDLANTLQLLDSKE